MEKIGAVSEEATFIVTEITKKNAKTIQDEKDVQIKDLNAAIEKEFKDIVVDIEK